MLKHLKVKYLLVNLYAVQTQLSPFWSYNSSPTV